MEHVDWAAVGIGWECCQTEVPKEREMCVLGESLFGLGEYAPPLKRESCNDARTFACVPMHVLH